MKCQSIKEKCVQVGDHVVVIGKVVEAGPYKEGFQSREDDTPLLYAKGHYRNTDKVAT